MSLLSILFLAISLAMDACAVSISCGLSCRRRLFKTAITISIAFGFFQAIMPIIGFFIGCSFRYYFSSIAHWISFCILIFVGLAMIKESYQKSCHPIQLDSIQLLLALSVATSMDALACGVSLSMLGSAILYPAFIIGMITAFICFTGVVIGRKLLTSNLKIQAKMEALAGFILIILAFKSLLY